MSDKKYRLVTRSDFDGLVCAVLLNELNLIDEINAQLDTQEEMLELAPQYLGEIPVSADSGAVDGNISESIEAYFGAKPVVENKDFVIK